MKGAPTIDQTRPDQTRPDQTRPDQPIARNSSLELLRIIGMLMVVAYHFKACSDFSFNDTSLKVNTLWMSVLSFGGSWGNDIFVLLSGYFLISSRSLNLLRLFRLWIRVFFYSVVFFIGFALFGRADFSAGTVLKIIMPVSTRQWWFVTYYFPLYIMHPYLNDVLHDLTRENYRKIIILLSGVWSVILLRNSDIKIAHIMNFICLYMIAGYVRLWVANTGTKKYICLGVFFLALSFVSCYVLGKSGLYFLGTNLLGTGDLKGLYPVAYLQGMLGIFNVLGIVCLIMGMRNMKFRHGRVINIIASAAFGVYLIHEDNFIRPVLWHSIFTPAAHQESPYLIPYSVIVVLAIYIVCAVIELARSKIFRVLSGGRLS